MKDLINLGQKIKERYAGKVDYIKIITDRGWGDSFFLETEKTTMLISFKDIENEEGDFVRPNLIKIPMSFIERIPAEEGNHQGVDENGNFFTTKAEMKPLLIVANEAIAAIEATLSNIKNLYIIKEEIESHDRAVEELKNEMKKKIEEEKEMILSNLKEGEELIPDFKQIESGE